MRKPLIGCRLVLVLLHESIVNLERLASLSNLAICVLVRPPNTSISISISIRIAIISGSSISISMSSELCQM